MEVMRTYGHDYKLIFVGDATMSPYEIVQPGGSIEHWNEEAGAVWMQRLTRTWPHHVWLNPEPEQRWEYTPSVQITRELIEDRMFPLTLRRPGSGDQGAALTSLAPGSRPPRSPRNRVDDTSAHCRRQPRFRRWLSAALSLPASSAAP